jgi:1,4-alpha-glucan branching enzyme
MKKTRKASGNGSARKGTIHLQFFEPHAKDVYIAGSFNEWQPEATPMIALGDGRWAKELALPAGRYEYRFVVDGTWVTDPNAAETAPNPFGSVNSVLQV